MKNIIYINLEGGLTGAMPDLSRIDAADLIVLYSLNEIIHINDLNKALRYYTFELKNKPNIVKLLLNASAIDEQIVTDYKIYIIEWFMLLTFYYGKFNSKWNSEGGDGLFLMGKPGHPHRAPLLYYLTKTTVWDKIKYSFNPCFDSKNYKDSVSVFENLGLDYAEFGKKYERSLDVPHAITSDIFCYHYTGFPYDVNLFKDTSLSIISETETQFRNKCITLTEKTWKAIANKHPFIIIGPCQIEKHLEKMGYDTFSYMRLHAANNPMISTNERVKLTAKNVEYFLHTYHKYKSRIEDGIEHNFKLFQQQSEETISTLHSNGITDLDTFVETVRYPNFR